MPSLSARWCHCRDRTWKSSSILTRSFRKITTMSIRWQTKRLTSSIVIIGHARASKKNTWVTYSHVQEAIEASENFIRKPNEISIMKSIFQWPNHAQNQTVCKFFYCRRLILGSTEHNGRFDVVMHKGYLEALHSTFLALPYSADTPPNSAKPNGILYGVYQGLHASDCLHHPFTFYK